MVSLMQHYDKEISGMQADICRLIEEKAKMKNPIRIGGIFSPPYADAPGYVLSDITH